MQFVPSLLTNLHMRKRQIHYKRETPISPESFTLPIKSVTKHLQLHRSVINYRRLGRIAIFVSSAPRANCSHQLTWDRRNCKDSSHCEPIVPIPTNMDPVLEGKTRMQFVPPLLTNLHMRKRQIHYKRETPISPESFILPIKSVTKHPQLHRSAINYRRLHIRSVSHNV